MAVITIPKALSERLGAEATDSFAYLLKEIEVEARRDSLVIAEERFEKKLAEEGAKLRLEFKAEANRLDSRITDEVAKLDKRITDEVAKLDKRITDEVAKLDKRITEEVAKLDVKISELRAEIIKWMFLFWAGQISITALLIKFLR